jgi:hypothetical protein
MMSHPLLIDEPGLSRAWARALLHMFDAKVKEVAPLVFSITGYDEYGVPVEDTTLRSELDRLLVEQGKYDVETVAFTIFPQEIWELTAPDRQQFYRVALESFPEYQQMNRRANGRGLYWERLLAFGESEQFDGNQLEFILKQYGARRGVRRSLLQAATFDPDRDHDPNPRLHFPCLQQVSFVPTKHGLITNAFYATQQLFYKAYGNLLGLSRLGSFMAHQMNLQLVRLNVYVGVEKLEGINKGDPGLQELVRVARDCLAPTGAER